MLLDPPLRQYIQQKEQLDDEIFEAVDWKAFKASMKKLTVHKQIYLEKYIFNWQKTGLQKQLFEDGQAQADGRAAECVGMCPMGSGECEILQHFLHCKVLHDTKIITRDFEGVQKWMKKKNTCPKLSIIIEKSLIHWMRTGMQIEMWKLQDTQYREDLESTIQAQHFIGWSDMLKGRIALE